MSSPRCIALTLAATISLTAACSPQARRTAAYATGGVALAGGAALAIGSNMQADHEDDVPFDEIGIGLGIGLAVVGAVILGVTYATSPDAPSAPASDTPLVVPTAETAPVTLPAPARHRVSLAFE